MTGTAAKASKRDLLNRLALVAVIAISIVSATWFIGEKQGFGEIGGGGVNASLLPKVGDPAPELLTFTTSGELFQLSSLRGQPVWLNFWGSWCAPCRSEMPELEAAYKTLRPQGLVMFGVSQKEEPAVAQAYADLAKATFPVLADPQMLRNLLPADQQEQVSDLLASWQIQNYPTHIFIDREGIVRAVVLAQMDYDTAVSYGEMILASPPPPDQYPAPATPWSSPIASPESIPPRR